jgi:2-amino-4-hydroxy-6-hydroxymethyldihydropteridine diphosphokinase
MTAAYVALGANLGDPVAAVQAALAALAGLPDSRVVRASSLYRTAPVGLSNQPDFINAVAALETALAPEALLDALFAIEAGFGRVRAAKNGPRTIDLDLLLHGDLELAQPRLTLPHPRLHLRAFVLVPLAEIAPDLRLPRRGSVAAWLPAVANQGIVRL